MANSERTNINEQIKKLQDDFRNNGLSLFLQGEGVAPDSQLMDRLIAKKPLIFPVGSSEILSPLKEALEQKNNALLAKVGDKWQLLVEQKKQGGCFIATAVYGSYAAPEVILLTEFRDQILVKSLIGKVLVKLYYLTSPPLAKFIAHEGTLKKCIRLGLMDPLVRRLRKMHNLQETSSLSIEVELSTES